MSLSRLILAATTAKQNPSQRQFAHRLHCTVGENASDVLALLCMQTPCFFLHPTPDDSLINLVFPAMHGSISRVRAQRGYERVIAFK